MKAIRTISPTVARRLAITRQRLAGPRPRPDREGIMEVARDLGYLQLDPIRVVERSHLLVLWSRLGRFDPADLDALLWQERALFEYWAYQASIVLTEDYPIHNLLMRTYPRPRPGESVHRKRTRDWLEQNRALRRSILARLRADGPLPLRAFEDRAVQGWSSSGWTSGRNVERMIDVLWTQGKVVVAGRAGIQKLFDLADLWFPPWTPRERLPEREVVRRAAQRSLRALGVATARQIASHFTMGRYAGLPQTLASLEREGLVERVRLVDDGEWPEDWFVHSEDLPLLKDLQAGDWQPRTTLLSPFDNLLINRARTESLFRFRYRMEIYVPKAKRQYGYYALPILDGDRLIGLVDPFMDRKSGALVVNAVHAAPDAPMTRAAGRSVAGAIVDLAAFLGAREVEYRGSLPPTWSKAKSRPVSGGPRRTPR
jgi:uncharacterized protein YcaQ